MLESARITPIGLILRSHTPIAYAGFIRIELAQENLIIPGINLPADVINPAKTAAADAADRCALGIALHGAIFCIRFGDLYRAISILQLGRAEFRLRETLRVRRIQPIAQGAERARTSGGILQSRITVEEFKRGEISRIGKELFTLDTFNIEPGVKPCLQKRIHVPRRSLAPASAACILAKLRAHAQEIIPALAEQLRTQNFNLLAFAIDLVHVAGIAGLDQRMRRIRCDPLNQVGGFIGVIAGVEQQADGRLRILILLDIEGGHLLVIGHPVFFLDVVFFLNQIAMVWAVIAGAAESGLHRQQVLAHHGRKLIHMLAHLDDHIAKELLVIFIQVIGV